MESFVACIRQGKPQEVQSRDIRHVALKDRGQHNRGGDHQGNDDDPERVHHGSARGNCSSR